MNLSVQGIITLRSSLAHGSFEGHSYVATFRREPVAQRDENGGLLFDPYAVRVQDASERAMLRAAGQRLLQIIWQSRSDAVQWTYSQLAERVALAGQMTNSIGDFADECLSKMGAVTPVFFEDDAEFFTRLLEDPNAGTLLDLFRQRGERQLLSARLRADSQARFEGRPGRNTEQLLMFAEMPAPEPPPFAPARAPYIARAPVFSANALRNGLFRRHAAFALLDRFGWRAPVDELRSLFNGGSLQKVAGEKGIDIDKRRALLELMPLYGLLGGGFNTNTLVEGSAKASKCWPIVREARPALPRSLWAEAEGLSMTEVMAVETYSSREDAVAMGSRYLNRPVILGGEKKDPRSRPHAAMMYETEAMIVNTRLYTEWRFAHATTLQVGAWLSALDRWAENPTLGGKGQSGHGLADVEYRLEGEPFAGVVEGQAVFSPQAQEWVGAYYAHLDARRDDLQKLLQATTEYASQEPAPAGLIEALQSEIEGTESDDGWPGADQAGAFEGVE